MKFADAPRMTKSMRIAMADLDLERLYIVYPGSENYDLDRNVRVIGMQGLTGVVSSL